MHNLLPVSDISPVLYCRWLLGKFICRNISLCSNPEAGYLGWNPTPPPYSGYTTCDSRGMFYPPSSPSCTTLPGTWRKRPLAKDHRKTSP